MVVKKGTARTYVRTLFELEIFTQFMNPDDKLNFFILDQQLGKDEGRWSDAKTVT